MSRQGKFGPAGHHVRPWHNPVTFVLLLVFFFALACVGLTAILGQDRIVVGGIATIFLALVLLALACVGVVSKTRLKARVGKNMSVEVGAPFSSEAAQPRRRTEKGA